MKSDSFNSEEDSFEEETESKTKNEEQDLNINLLESIAKTLTLIVEENKNLKNYKDIIQKQSKMVFSANSVPSISIVEYLKRTQTYANLEKNTLISCLIFIDRFCELSKTTLTYYNIHRILFASIITSIKYNEDSFYDNKYYAQIAGIKIEELNMIEEEFVLMCDFQFYISDDIFENYNKYLTSFEKMK